MSTTPMDGQAIYIPESLRQEVQSDTGGTYELIRNLLRLQYGVLITENITGVGDRITVAKFKNGQVALG